MTVCATEPNGNIEPGALIFRHEGDDDFLEARIAAKRVPEGEQFELAVTERDGVLQSYRELFAGQIFLPDPRGNEGV